MYKIDKKILFKLFKDPESRNNLYYLYLDILDPLGLTNCEIKINKGKLLANDIEYLENHKFIEDYFYPFIDLKEEKCSDYQKRITINDSMILVHDFFKTFDKEIYDAFLLHFNNRFDHLRLTNNIFFSSYSGEAFVNKKTNDYFITMKKEENLDFSKRYCHELGHIIGEVLSNTGSFTNNELFIEIPSMFFEYLFMNYIRNITEFKSEIKNMFNEQIAMFKTDSNDIINKFEIIRNSNLIIDENNALTKKQFFTRLASDSCLSKEELKYYLTYPVEYSTRYMFSAMYAMSLLDLYQLDPQKAIYAFKKICNLKPMNDEIKINKIKELGVLPAQNIDSLTRILKR